jgi:DNA adenine methylase
MTRAAAKPFAYYGAKAGLTEILLALMPDHECYVEPFCGSASLLFAKPRSAVETINDADGAICNFFRVLRDPVRSQKLRHLLERTPYAREEWQECRASWRYASDDVEAARRWYTAIMQSFSGHLVNSGWSYTRDASHNPAHTWRAAIDALPRFCERLVGVQIECGDFARVISAYDGPRTLFYCDPPYLPETRSGGPDRRYTVEMEVADHARLLDVLRSVRGMVLLSGYDAPLYQEALADWECVRKDVVCASSRTTRATTRRGQQRLSKGERTECIWRNPAAVAAAVGQASLFEVVG